MFLNLVNYSIVEESKRLIAAARLIQSEIKEKNYSEYCLSIFLNAN